MNDKLTALSTLAHAFHYVVETYPAGSGGRGAMHILADKFGYIRRSLRIEDLKPVKCNEGWNGKGPTHL
jgi:hypothetical protein